MARFDIYRNGSTHQASTPYLMDVQSDHLDALHTRIVIPLRRLDSFPKVSLPRDLIPVLTIEDIACLIDTPQLAAIPLRELKIRVTAPAIDRDAVMAALDRLFGAY